MFQHFVGKVFLFHEPPQEEFPFVQIPILEQAVDTPASLLIQMDESDLTRRSLDVVKKYSEQPILSYSVIKENHGVDPERQLRLVEYLTTLSTGELQNLVWN